MHEHDGWNLLDQDPIPVLNVGAFLEFPLVVLDSTCWRASRARSAGRGICKLGKKGFEYPQILARLSQADAGSQAFVCPVFGLFKSTSTSPSVLRLRADFGKCAIVVIFARTSPLGTLFNEPCVKLRRARIIRP